MLNSKLLIKFWSVSKWGKNNNWKFLIFRIFYTSPAPCSSFENFYILLNIIWFGSVLKIHTATVFSAQLSNLKNVEAFCVRYRLLSISLCNHNRYLCYTCVSFYFIVSLNVGPFQCANKIINVFSLFIRHEKLFGSLVFQNTFPSW